MTRSLVVTSLTIFYLRLLGSFVPIVLEQLARENGFLLSDPSQPCSGPLQDHSPSNLTNTTTPGLPDDNQCIVSVLGFHVNTASFAMYTFSLSVLVQAFVVITMSGVADHGAYRKTLLISFAAVGAVATMLFLTLTPSVFLLGPLLAIVANTCVGASFVLLNSFLPLLVRHHPTVKEAHATAAEPLAATATVHQDQDGPVSQADVSESIQDSTSALLPGDFNEDGSLTPAPSKSTSVELQLMTKISSTGTGIGYLASVLVQLISVLLVLVIGGTLFSLKLVLFLVGAWWAVFTLPSALWLRPRPGPPLPAASLHSNKRPWLAYMTHSWKSLARTAVRARRLKDMLIFLAAWFLLSDGTATISSTAVLFAKTTLGMKPGALAMINVIVMVFGVFGAFTWSTASRRLGLKPSQTILACVCVFELIPCYALLGYLPIPIGLKNPWEIYLLGAVYGLVLGGLSSYCRAVFGELIPPGSEAAFYALYAITDKGSSIFGPAVVGAITDATGEIRPAFAFLAILVGLPIPLLALIDVDRGRREALALATELSDGAEAAAIMHS